MSEDRSWIHMFRSSPEYRNGVKGFIEKAKLHVNEKGETMCPCNNCSNVYWHIPGIVETHLLLRGFQKTYTRWYCHGETISTTVETNIDDVDFCIDDDDVSREALHESVEIEVSRGRVDENGTGGSSVEVAFHQDHEEKIIIDSSGIDIIPVGVSAGPLAVAGDEPYIGQEFDSEAAAHAYYNAYASRVGFVIRVSKLSRSRRDGTAIGRALVCNKEGYRMPDKREKIVRQRVETRVGCRAMILVRKVSSGKWVVTKFIKEHAHPMTPGKGRRDCIYDQYPNEHDKIRELSQQLAVEKKRSATYKRHLEVIFEHIEEHNASLSKKIQHIVDSVRDLETKTEQINR